MKQRWAGLNARQWEELKRELVDNRGVKGHPMVVEKGVVEGVLWHYRNITVEWRDIPERFGKWNSIYKAHARWLKDGRIKKILAFARKEDLIADE